MHTSDCDYYKYTETQFATFFKRYLRGSSKVVRQQYSVIMGVAPQLNFFMIIEKYLILHIFSGGTIFFDQSREIPQ